MFGGGATCRVSPSCCRGPVEGRLSWAEEMRRGTAGPDRRDEGRLPRVWGGGAAGVRLRPEVGVSPQKGRGAGVDGQQLRLVQDFARRPYLCRARPAVSAAAMQAPVQARALLRPPASAAACVLEIWISRSCINASSGPARLKKQRLLGSGLYTEAIRQWEAESANTGIC